MYLVFGVADLDGVLAAHCCDGFHGGINDVVDSEGGDGGEKSDGVEAEGRPENLLADVVLVSFFNYEVGFEGHVEGDEHSEIGQS